MVIVDGCWWLDCLIQWRLVDEASTPMTGTSLCRTSARRSASSVVIWMSSGRPWRCCRCPGVVLGPVHLPVTLGISSFNGRCWWFQRTGHIHVWMYSQYVYIKMYIFNRFLRVKLLGIHSSVHGLVVCAIWFYLAYSLACKNVHTKSYKRVGKRANKPKQINEML